MDDSLIPILAPNLGESISQATVARWLKKVGEPIENDQLLVELETDKVTLEVNAPQSGILEKIIIPQGKSVKIGEVLGYLLPISSEILPIENASKGEASKDKNKHKVQVKFPDSDANKTISNDSSKPTLFEEPQAKPEPLVQKTPNAPLPDRFERRESLSPLRLKIAERLKQAQNTAAILTTFNEVDLSVVQNLRNHYKADFEKKYQVKLGLMSFFIKAITQALKEMPLLNSHIEGNDVIYNSYYDIGVAVAGPQGLVVPIIRNADTLSYAEIEQTLAELSKRAKSYQLTPDDLRGGTFTLSNGGVFGSLLSTPILNPPQSAILGLHKIQDRPIAVNGQVQIRPMMYLALSYDHRLIDGKEAVTFLKTIKEALENFGHNLLFR